MSAWYSQKEKNRWVAKYLTQLCLVMISSMNLSSVHEWVLDTQEWLLTFTPGSKQKLGIWAEFFLAQYEMLDIVSIPVSTRYNFSLQSRLASAGCVHRIPTVATNLEFLWYGAPSPLS